MDDRCPFEAAVSVVRAIAKLSPRFEDEDAVVEAVVASGGSQSRAYLQAIARTGHSVFYEQMQRLYEFGKEQVPASARDRLCREAGREFAVSFFDESLRPLLMVALERRGPFRVTLKRMVRSYVSRYTNDRYSISAEMTPGAIEFKLRYAEPEIVHAYLAHHGLDPADALRNSSAYVAGAIEGLISQLVEGYDGADFALDCSGNVARFRVPVRDSDRFAYDPLIAKLLGHIDELEARRRNAALAERLESDLIVGSEGMLKTWDLIRRASRTSEIVLLRGESGTGKSFLARKIHELSDRASGPFVEVALTSDVGTDDLVQSHLFGHERGAYTGAVGEKQGLFSLADGGTIFLDEIGDASPDVQSRLLRVLDSSTFKRLGGARDVKVDVRVIAATNRDLESMADAGTFRRDLYYRLCVIPIRLPTLRDRPGDVPALAEFLLARAQAEGRGPRRRLAPGIAAKLSGHPWPGNVRELDHALKYAAAMASSEEIEAGDFPASVRDVLLGVAARPAADDPARGSGVIDEAALRREIRGAALRRRGAAAESPAHVDHARRAWLAALIDEFDGDLSLVGRFWDRSSEKTLRAAVRAFGLTERLAVARARKRR
jgi:DNA-binding NtrC family response regulator